MLEIKAVKSLSWPTGEVDHMRAECEDDWNDPYSYASDQII
jgi:hypothetical protein